MFKDIVRTLTPRYGAGEARAMAFILLEDAFGLSRTDIYAGKVKNFSEQDALRLQNILQRLLTGEPLQYVLGSALFCGLRFAVSPATLIPRPETEELVEWADSLMPALAERQTGDAPALLDAGTGTGCIAITLACRHPQFRVSAWDLSPEALGVARQNAATHKVQVDFALHDLLTEQPAPSSLNLIVSNPPYVCQRERADMEAHVLEHEPALALFVPDDDPLRFYRALERIGRHALRPGGWLLMEINRAYGNETAALFAAPHWTNTQLRPDSFGNCRMVGTQKL